MTNPFIFTSIGFILMMVADMIEQKATHGDELTPEEKSKKLRNSLVLSILAVSSFVVSVILGISGK